MKGEAHDEVFVRDVDEKLGCRVLDDLANYLFELRIQVFPRSLARCCSARSDDPRQDEDRQMVEVSVPQIDPDVLAHQGVENLGDRTTILGDR